ncbi:ABC transporter substrate-binding protein [Nonomuraea sp. NBC_01738]|uniref:ABC transporter substrate-binding protein n=1 Tax=Nonomuraea sp. NBC_01738 TaxID=2976003 RepID=UPI002E1241AC|nr:ABC transporter substrate-binding protein [Nonomuraea sp. NBC_01738]
MKAPSRLLGAAIGAVLALSLSGCGSTAPEGTGQVKLTLWHNSADPAPLLEMYKKFEKQSGHKIELVSIPSDGFEDTTQTKWATGDRPDILEYHATVSGLLALNPAENLRDLTGEAYIARSGDLYQAAGAVNGKVYAAITGFPQVFGLYYNKKLLPEPPRSFADLGKVCATLKPSGVTPIFEAGGSIWPTQILPILYLAGANQANAYGKAIAGHSGTLADPGSPFVAGLSAYAKLKSDGCFNKDIVTAKFEDSMKALVTGKAAMVAQHSDMLPALLAAAGGDQKTVDETVGFVGLSSDKPLVTYAPGPIGTFYLPKTGDAGREKAALDFVRFMTGPAYAEYITASKTFPVLKDVPGPQGVSSVLQDVKKAYDSGAVIAFNSDIPGMGGLAQLMSELIAGQKDPQKAATQLQGQVEQAAKAAGLPGW